MAKEPMGLGHRQGRCGRAVLDGAGQDDLGTLDAWKTILTPEPISGTVHTGGHARGQRHQRGCAFSMSKQTGRLTPDRELSADHGAEADPEEVAQHLQDPSWEITSIDPRTGQLLSQQELDYRGRIRSEAARGLIAVDPLYQARHHDIHQPIIDEHGKVVDENWELRRRNKITLRISFSQIGNVNLLEAAPARLEELAVTIAGKALGDLAAEVMRQMYMLANDPPNWRQGELTVKLTDLLDRLKYERDNRGIHRSANRRRLSQTLLALQFTQIGLQRETDGVSVGSLGSLISNLEYRTRESVADLSPAEVFAQGLPEDITVMLNPRWYRLRDSDGNPLNGYALVPRTAIGTPDRRRRNARAVTPYIRLQHYLSSTEEHATRGTIMLTREALLRQAGITDQRRRQATQTLAKVLERLCADALLQSYAPRPLPIEPSDYVTLTLPR